MRLFLLVFCLFSLAHANFFDDLLQSYDEQGEALCVQVNMERYPPPPRKWYEEIYLGFSDGFYDCETRDSNTAYTKLDPANLSLYGINGSIGVFFRKLFNLR
ncbi:hypothetical protein GCK72_003318 [Caenorhabditis remanei]|uniref:Uncharacterized protein n=1 Tax=Caenorhabditis remanei TaxID=31234 RepID=A0A6A5HW64_CAERE|nr:hypothetical protein GCK72_003318 [Caenorhabditis remanei]KAF1771491.1 hypothetical protein GCK72_003318 [Caenorhabditis remanei]